MVGLPCATRGRGAGAAAVAGIESAGGVIGPGAAWPNNAPGHSMAAAPIPADRSKLLLHIVFIRFLAPDRFFPGSLVPCEQPPSRRKSLALRMHAPREKMQGRVPKPSNRQLSLKPAPDAINQKPAT